MSGYALKMGGKGGERDDECIRAVGQFDKTGEYHQLEKPVMVS